MPPPDYQNVYLDLHTYQCFDDTQKKWPQHYHLQSTCTFSKQERETQTLWTMTGEWSLCTGQDPSGYPDEDTIKFLRQYSLAQMNAYQYGEKGKGWFFWNFKTESATVWNYLLGLKGGWFPAHLPSNETDPANCYFWCNQDCCFADMKSGDKRVQEGLDWTCQQTPDTCRIINPGGEFYYPNDLYHHASYAFNTWWTNHHDQSPTQGCNFNSAAAYCKRDCAKYL